MNKAEELIACLEGEIAKRDEVIAGLTNSRDFWREKAITTDDKLAAIEAQEPVGWYTEDHLDDKSATTYSWTVAERWVEKGWPVSPLYAAPAAPAADAWIPVSERLPGDQGHDSEEVLCFLNGHCSRLDNECRQGGGWGIRLGYYDADIGTFRVFGRPKSHVTHWMPLPAAPIKIEANRHDQ